VKTTTLDRKRVRELLKTASATRVLVVVTSCSIILSGAASPHTRSPVPVLELLRESFMPGGAGNVARNLTSLRVRTDLFGTVGEDPSGQQLKQLLQAQRIECRGLAAIDGRPTSVKSRVVAHSQQVVRIDRESRDGLSDGESRKLAAQVIRRLGSVSAVIVCDYGKGVVTQQLLNELKAACRRHGVWLSLDPKPVHQLNLAGLSLITPNRKEAFELAAIPDDTRHPDPLRDRNLLRVCERLLHELRPALLLITLGESGMLLCERDRKPFHIPTIAQEVFDVSGAGEHVIANLSRSPSPPAASPLEAAIIANLKFRRDCRRPGRHRDRQLRLNYWQLL